VSRTRLKPLAVPRGLRVEEDDRTLPRAVWNPQRRPVAAVRESWRIDDEWWRHRVSRTYHTVVLEDGRLLTLFRDMEDGRWYRHG
jgi:hypothetical protein